MLCGQHELFLKIKYNLGYERIREVQYGDGSIDMPSMRLPPGYLMGGMGEKNIAMPLQIRSGGEFWPVLAPGSDRQPAHNNQP